MGETRPGSVRLRATPRLADWSAGTSGSDEGGDCSQAEHWGARSDHDAPDGPSPSPATATNEQGHGAGEWLSDTTRRAPGRSYSHRLWITLWTATMTVGRQRLRGKHVGYEACHPRVPGGLRRHHLAVYLLIHKKDMSPLWITKTPYPHSS